MLLQRVACQELWWHHTWKRRLVKPPDADQSKYRWPDDERWVFVRSMGLPRFDARQIPREVRELTRSERIARDVYDAAQAAIRYAARSAIALEDFTEVGDALVVMGRALQAQCARDLLAPLASELDIEAAAGRAAASSQFFREEAEADSYRMVDALDAARGRPVTRCRAWKEPDDDEEEEGETSTCRGGT
jgi:hypothetical protein